LAYFKVNSLTSFPLFPTTLTL